MSRTSVAISSGSFAASISGDDIKVLHYSRLPCHQIIKCSKLLASSSYYGQRGNVFSHLSLYPQPNLYPTVGLQTPGEIVDANFGQQPFVFDIEDYMSEWRAKIHGMIARFPIGERLGEWQAVLQK